MIAKLAVEQYKLLHGRLGISGGGWILRRCLPFASDLTRFPLVIPGVGIATLDFRDPASYSLLNYTLGDLGTDEHLVPLIGRCLKPDAVFWDVGANVGTISAYAMDPSHKLGRLHAFEPNASALRTLNSLFHGNDRARIHPIALGAEDGELMMNVDTTNSHLGSLARDAQHVEHVKVSVRSGDSLIRTGEASVPDVIKIDVEGFEPQVLSGCVELIENHRPILFIEHIWLTDAAVNSLVPKGYELHFIGDDGSIFQQCERRSRSHDALLLPEEKLSLLQA